MSIRDNLAAVRGDIARAAERAGRAPEDVRLIAVAKTKPQSAVVEALEAGQMIFGENRVQESQGKYPDLRADWPDMELHLIGPLQTNKARDAMALFDVIHGPEGAAPADTEALVALVRAEGLPLEGLMCIPPVEDAPSGHFAFLKRIADGLGLAWVSMGMSGDYPAAVELGATHIRVGSAIFGAR